MALVLNGTTGITNDGGYTGDGVVFADTTPANTLVTTTGGNVGVGTSSPATYGKLAVSTGTDKDGVSIVYTAGPTGTNGPALNFYNTSNTAIYKGASVQGICTNGGGGGSSDLVFSTTTNGTLIDRGRFDSGGNLLVGLTSAQSGIAADPIGISLYGNGSATSQGVGIFTRNSGNGVLYVNAKVSAASLINFYCNNTTVGVISSNGSTTTYGTSSDYRLKENVQPMAGALARVAALKPVTYTWKNTGAYDEGFIAHELQEVCPSAVSGKKDAVNEDGSIKPQSIDTSFLVATLTAAIQEQQAIITALTARVEALDARLISLEGTQP
jgi:hypothetical protein